MYPSEKLTLETWVTGSIGVGQLVRDCSSVRESFCATLRVSLERKEKEFKVHLLLRLA